MRARLMVAGEEAKRAGLPLLVHATQLANAKDALHAGVKVLVHSVAPEDIDDEFLALAKANGTIVIPTLTVFEGYADVYAGRSPAARYPLACVDAVTRAHLETPLPDSLRAARLARMKATGRFDSAFHATERNVARMRTAGIPIAMGTDAGNPGTAPGPSVYREMEALQAAGMPAAEVFASATIVAARAMGRDSELGLLDCETRRGPRGLVGRSDRGHRQREAGRDGDERRRAVRARRVAPEMMRMTQRLLPDIPMRRLSIALISLAAAASLAAQAAAHPAPRPLPPQKQVPTLVIFLTVDQMRADYLTRFGPQLTGGLGRLAKNGAFFTNAMLDYEATETAPGHSVGMSGRFPRSTGIVSNSLGAFDPQAPVIGSTTMFASPFRFRGGGLTEWLRIKDPRTRALSVSRKDRGAIFPLGRTHQSAFWYDPASGNFSTSTYYADTLPTWIRTFNAKRIPASYAGSVWTLLLPDSAYPEKDSVVWENFGTDFMFPHPLSKDTADGAAQLRGFAVHGRGDAAGGARRNESDEHWRGRRDRCARDLTLHDGRDRSPLRPRFAGDARPDPAARPRTRRVLRFRVRGARLDAHRHLARSPTTASPRCPRSTRRGRTSRRSGSTSPRSGSDSRRLSRRWAVTRPTSGSKTRCCS